MLIISLLTAFLLFDIPKLPPLPVSPRFIILGLALLLILQNRRILLNALAQLPAPFYAYFLMVFLLGVLNGHLRNIIAPIEAIVYFATVVGFMLGNPARAVWFTRFISVLFFTSILWLLGSIFLEQPFMAIRQFVYAAHVGNYPGSELQLLKPTGLTFNHFNMGYQVSVGLALSLFLWIAERGVWRKIWAGVSIVMLVGMMYVAQRSTIPAVSIALGLSLLVGRKWRQLAALSMLSILGVLAMGSLLDVDRGDTLQMRMLTIEDTADRLGWQLAAIKVVAQNPMGNILGNLDWETESIEEGADYSYYGWSTKAVHNAYLGRMVAYGWIGVVLVMACILYAYTKIVRPSLLASDTSRHKYFAEASAYAFIAVSVQAIFHNSSVFTVEPSSWVIFSVAAGWAAILKREKFQEKVKTNA